MQKLSSSCTLQDAFPDEGKASICSVYFSSAHLTEKTWFDFDSLAKSDPVTFWTVVAHHQQLGPLIRAGLSKLDHAQHSTSIPVRRSVKKTQGKALTSVLLRLSCDTAECVRRRVDPADLAKKVHALLPLKQFLVFNASVMQYHHGVLASLAGCAFHLVNPLLLCEYNAFVLEWRETVDQIVKRCVKELGRGRYQRQSGDVLLLFEQTYRVVKLLWALLSSCPFVADYLHLESVLRGLRIIADVISPLLQHFLLTCGALSARREMLSKANAGVLNASLSAAILLFLFRSFSTTTTAATTSAVQGEPKERRSGWDGERRCLRPELVRQVEERVRECAEVYLRGFPSLLFHRVLEEGRSHEKRQEGGGGVRRGGGGAAVEDGTPFRVLFEALWGPPQPPKSQLEQPTRKGTSEWRLGEMLLVLKNPVISDNGDFARVNSTRQRFFELLLAELANQQVHLDHHLRQRGLLTEEETEVLAECQQSVMGVLAGVPLQESCRGPTSSSSTAPPDAHAGKSGERGEEQAMVSGVRGEGSSSSGGGGGGGGGDLPLASTSKTNHPASPFPPGSLGACVHEVLPHFSVSMIQAALQHYHDDVEHLISDALMENLPPHLSTALQTPPIPGTSPRHGGEAERLALQAALDAAPCGGEEEARLLQALVDLSQEEDQEAGPHVMWNPDLLLPTATTTTTTMTPAAAPLLQLTNDDFDDALQIRDLSLFFWETERVPRQKRTKGGRTEGGEGASGHPTTWAENEEEEEEEEESEQSTNSEHMVDQLLGDVTADYITYHPDDGEETADWGWSSNTGTAFQVSAEMKDKIKALAEMMLYEDELDEDRDAELPLRNLNRPEGASRKGGGRRGGGGRWHEDSEEDEEEEEEEYAGADGVGRGEVVMGGERGRHGEPADAVGENRHGSRVVEPDESGAAGGIRAFLPRPPPRSDYDRKHFQAQREKERLGYGAKPAAETQGENEGDSSGAQENKPKRGGGGGHPAGKSENRPAYEKKKKTVKEMHKIREKARKVVF